MKRRLSCVMRNGAANSSRSRQRAGATTSSSSACTVMDTSPADATPGGVQGVQLLVSSQGAGRRRAERGQWALSWTGPAGVGGRGGRQGVLGRHARGRAQGAGHGNPPWEAQAAPARALRGRVLASQCRGRRSPGSRTLSDQPLSVCLNECSGTCVSGGGTLGVDPSAFRGAAAAARGAASSDGLRSSARAERWRPTRAGSRLHGLSDATTTSESSRTSSCNCKTSPPAMLARSTRVICALRPLSLRLTRPR